MKINVKIILLLLSALLLLPAITACSSASAVPESPFTVVYGESTENNSADVWLPDADVYSKTPVFIYFHGGAWNYGSRTEFCTTFAPLLEKLLNSGFAVVSADYSLTRDGYKWADCAADVLDCVQWFYDNADEYGIDRDMIIVGGYSAGAHLALTAAFCTGLESLTAASGREYTYKAAMCVDIAGPVNFSYLDEIYPPIEYMSTALDSAIPLLFDSEAENYYDLKYDANPLNSIDSSFKTVKLLIIAGENDTVVPSGHIEDIYSTASTFDIDADYIEIANMTHIFTAFNTEKPVGISFDEMCDIIVESCVDRVG